MEIPNEPIEVITTKTMKYWIVDDVRYANILKNAYIDVVHVQENAEARKPLLNADRAVPMIIDITQIDKLTKEGRTLSSTLTEWISLLPSLLVQDCPK